MPVVDGVTLDDYVAIAEYLYDNDVLAMESIGTLTHELGHYIGLPDLYDTNYYSLGSWSKYDVNALSLMNYGGYGEDLDGNPIPFSLDMWSRVRLGWVEPAMLDDEAVESAQIAGSLSTTTTPIAYRINTAKEDEYYLIENRRFTSWDEGMGNFYPSGLLFDDDDASEDLGGGLVLWHIDDNIVRSHMASNSVNNSDHHPGVMPIFYEADADENLCTIGKTVYPKFPFFDSEGWGGWSTDVPLPLYGTNSKDKPSDRTLSTDLVLSLDSASAPVMDFHLHVMSPTVSWSDDYSSASLWGTCLLDMEFVDLETTTDITSEVVQNPTATEMGKVAHTAHFAKYGVRTRCTR